MTKRISSRIARPIGIAVALVCGGLFTSMDAPRAQPSADPVSQDFDGSQPPAIESTTPAAEATGVSGRNPLMVQFNKHMAVASLNSQTFTLVGPGGAEPVGVVPLEQGRIVFLWPRNEMLPASRYTLFVKGANDNAQHPLPLVTIGFDTAAKPAGPMTAVAGSGVAPATAPALQAGGASPDDMDRDSASEVSQLGAPEQLALLQAEHSGDPEDWVPGLQHFHGRWRADRAPSPLEVLPPLRALQGVTALSGRVLGMNGRAVRGITLRIGDQEARTDVTGRFLLQAVQPGFAKLEIDGATADRADIHYGYYATRIELTQEQTTVVPYVIWMPRLDPAGTVHIAAPTTVETIVTSPRIPGLELHIPAGTVIRDRQGKIVTELNMTAIPVDRPPFPVPDLGVPVYFTVQPGGAVLQSVTGKPGPGARLFYPNFKHEAPGARGTFWNYDPEEREWFVYGLGTISADARQAIPDNGVVIHELTGAMFDGGNTPGPNGPPPCPAGDENDAECGEDGDPVSLPTGQFDHVEHDIFLKDVNPIDITRTYNSYDLNQRTFGIGMALSYDVFLYSQNQYQEVDVILPNGRRVHYVRITPGNDFPTAVFQSSAPGVWNSSIIARSQTRAGWDLFFRDGRKWFFFQYQPLMEMTDANGNVTRIVRQDSNGTSGKVARIISPNGRTVNFTYNAAGFVSAITDNIDRSWSYSYDAGNRLVSATDPGGGTRTYAWDNNRITEIHDVNGNLVVRNQYDSWSHVSHQDLADGGTYDYDYTLGQCQPLARKSPPILANSGIVVPVPGPYCVFPIAQVDVVDRRGTHRRLQFDGQGNVVKDTFALGLPEEQIVNYELTNGLLTAKIDPLGRRTEYQYDAAGNLTRVTRMAGTAEAASWNTTWDAALARPLTITEPNGNTTTFTYDAKGNFRTLQNAPGQIWTYAYDAQGRRLTSTNPLGKVTTLAYEGPDLVSVTDPGGRQVQFSSDALGRQIAIVDPLGNRTIKQWDDLDRLVSKTDALGGVTSFSYDAAGNVLSHTDAKGNTTSFTYNEMNQTQHIQDPLSKGVNFAYEAGGRVALKIDRKGQWQAMTHDALGRLKTVGYGATATSPTAYTSTIENTWDVVGRLTQLVERVCADPEHHLNCSSIAATHIITRAYDSFDHMVQEITPQGEVDYTYDSVGRRTSMTIKNGAPEAQVV